MSDHENDEERYAIPGFFTDPGLRPYLNNVIGWHCHHRMLGCPGKNNPTETTVDRRYVAPLLTRRYVSPNEDSTKWLEEAELAMETTIASHKAVLVIGDAGSGKTMLASNIALALSRPSSNTITRTIGWKLPLPMKLGELEVQGASSFDELLGKALSHPASEPLAKIEGDGKSIEQRLAEGGVFLLLDGLDEVGDRKDRLLLNNAIRDGMNRWPRCHWLMTSRATGYEEAPIDITEHPKDGIVKRYLAPLTDDRIAHFARLWCNVTWETRDASRRAWRMIHAIHEDPSTLRLARTPAHLALMAIIHERDPEELLPRRRALLYERAIEINQQAVEEQRGTRDHQHQNTLERQRRRIARLGLKMQIGGPRRGTRYLADRDTLLSWMNEQHERHEQQRIAESEAVLDANIGRNGRLLTPRNDGCTFVHTGVQEALAADTLERGVTRLQWIKHRNAASGFTWDDLSGWAEQSRWQETLIQLFERLALEEETDWYEELLECLFGKRFEKITQGKRAEPLAALGTLLARLIAEPHAGFPPHRRDEAIRICIDASQRLEREIKLWRTGPTRPIRDILSHFGRKRLTQDPLEPDELDKFNKINKNVVDQTGALRGWESSQGDETIDVGDVPISSCEDLAWLQPKTLGLRRAQIEDIEPLASSRALEDLDLAETPIHDLTPLKHLSRLRQIDVSYTAVEDLSPLGALGSLRSITAIDTRIRSVEALGKLVALKNLELAHCPIEDIGPLAGLAALESLDLTGTWISDLDPIRNLHALRTLDLKNTRVSDLSPITALTRLETIDLSNSNVEDIAPLATLEELRHVDLSGSSITDLRPMTKLPKLVSLILQKMEDSRAKLIEHMIDQTPRRQKVQVTYA